ncbi:MAG: alpha/beta hydrolase [Chloroflexi bacterium]|nr:alpha/beta hydrolase [Chloroflexota bacterium]
MAVQDRWIELRGGRFHYREWSTSGLPIVLLHGLASQSHIFDYVAPLLAARMRVLALDQRGHGESDKPDAGYDFANVTADLFALLDSLRIQRAVILGHSWGGNVALEFAARHPRRALALVLVDGGFVDMQSDSGMTWAVARERLAPPRLAGMPLRGFRAMVKTHMGATWTPAVERVVLQNFEVLPDQTIRPHLSFEHHMKILRSLWEQRPPTLFGEVKCPVLIVPARSESTDPRDRAFLAAKRAAARTARVRLKSCEVVWFDHSAHDIPLQRPRKLANAIIRFARGHSLSRATR